MASMVTPKKDKNGTYNIRKVVPPELRCVVGKTALKRSLKTKNWEEAKRAAPAVIAALNAVVDKARRELENKTTFSLPLVTDIAFCWFNTKLQEADWKQYLTDDFEPLTGELTSILESMQSTPERKQKQLESCVGPFADDALQLNNLEQSSTDEFRQPLLIEIAKYYIKLTDTAFIHHANEVRLKHYNPPPANASSKVTPQTAQAEKTPDSKSTTGITLAKLYERYCAAHRRRDPKGAEKRIVTYNAAHSRAIEFFDAENIESITKRNVACFREVLEQLPRQPKPEIKRLSLCKQIEVADKNNLPRVSSGTVRTQLNAVSALFKFAVDEGYLESNPANGVSSNILRSASGTGKEYTRDEILQIFGSAIYSHGQKPKQADYGDAHYWLPLVLYYTGARVEEIAQLYVSHVDLAHDIPHIRLTPEHDDQSIKTNEERVVPIHSHLFELGFREYITGLPADGRLFPKLTQDSQGKYHYNVASWLSKFIRMELRISRPQLKPMHGFRHTFITQCRELNVREDIQNAITGHSQRSMGSQYGTISLEVMQAEINRIPKCQ